MSYLKIEAGSETKQYLVTSSYSKPYIVVKNQGVVPLTTNTTHGLQLKIKDENGQTYRPMEFESVSSSDTFYTTALDSEGLSSVTALTRESTSGTSALTGSVSNQMKRFISVTFLSTSTSSFINGGQTIYRTFTYSSTNNSDINILNTSAQSVNTSVTKLSWTGSGTYSSTYNYVSGKTEKTANYYTSNNSTSSEGSSTSSTGTHSVATSGSLSLKYDSNATSQTGYSSYSYRTSYSYTSESYYKTSQKYSYVQSAANYMYSKLGSNVTIHDLRSSLQSTTGTSYLTCSSTSAYSGVSSSSYESSGWR